MSLTTASDRRTCLRAGGGHSHEGACRRVRVQVTPSRKAGTVNRVILTNDYSRKRAIEAVVSAPAGYVCIIKPPTRSDDQNDKLHAMIDDIRKQVPEAGKWSKEDWKLRFLHALRNETRFLPDIEGEGLFPVGQKTSTLTKEQFSALIEIIYEWGARRAVRWSDEEGL